MSPHISTENNGGQGEKAKFPILWLFPQFAFFTEGRTPYLPRIRLLRKIFTLTAAWCLTAVWYLTAVLPRRIVLNQEGHFKGKTAPRLARSS